LYWYLHVLISLMTKRLNCTYMFFIPKFGRLEVDEFQKKTADLVEKCIHTRLDWNVPKRDKKWFFWNLWLLEHQSIQTQSATLCWNRQNKHIVSLVPIWNDSELFFLLDVSAWQKTKFWFLLKIRLNVATGTSMDIWHVSLNSVDQAKHKCDGGWSTAFN